jgi:plastocyanin
MAALPSGAVSRGRALTYVAVSLLAVGACGGDDSGGGDAGSESATSIATVEVTALDNFFEPEQVSVAAGTAVMWRNDGAVYHNVVPEHDRYGFGVDQSEFDVGDTYTFVFTTPGTYRYVCDIHGTIDAGMIGTVTVTP